MGFNQADVLITAGSFDHRGPIFSVQCQQKRKLSGQLSAFEGDSRGLCGSVLWDSFVIDLDKQRIFLT